jgi:glycosyltransferase involved in cell wall biosynthesis
LNFFTQNNKLVVGEEDHVRGSAPSHLPRVLYAMMLSPGEKFGSMEEQLVTMGHAFAKAGGLFLPLFMAPPRSQAIFSPSSSPRPDPSDDLVRHGIAPVLMDLRTFTAQRAYTLSQILRRERIDLIHWNFTHPIANGYLWAISVLNPGVRHWFTDHISRPAGGAARPVGARKLIKRLLLRRYQKTLAVSDFVASALNQQNVWGQVATQYHMINTERFRPDAQQRMELRAREGVGDNCVLIAVGQLIPEKGIDVLLNAMVRLPAHVVLWIVGGGPEEHALRTLVDRLGLQQRVVFFGVQRLIEPFLRAADIFVCPSVWAEAAGLVNIEAQATGLPVIASRIGGIPEHVADHQTGLLFEPGDEHELVRHICYLASDAVMRNRMSESARQWAIKRFSSGAHVQRIVDVYAKGH